MPSLRLMAGPTASVLLPPGGFDLRREDVRPFLKRRGTHSAGNDIWIAERPFVLGFGAEVPDEFGEMAANGLAVELGWPPVDCSWLAAMCNSDDDHRLLAEECIAVSEAFDGGSDFCGPLGGFETLPGNRPSKAVRLEVPRGRLFATNYLTVSGVYATNHIGDADFVRYWISQPSFRMIK